MDQLGNIIFENQQLENERLELTDKVAHYFLGPALTLRRCTVTLKIDARRLFLNQVRLIDCDVELKQELKNHHDWVGASLEGCRFKGRLTGCDFGHWPEYSSQPWCQHGSIEDCDFSEARLDGCRIIGSDPSSIRFPTWPCFTLLEPIRRAPELRRVRWPGVHGDLLPDTLLKNPPTTRALTYYAPSAARLLETTPEALRERLATLEGVVY